MRIAFFGDTSHPNAAGWVRDLVELHDLEIHAIDYGPPRLAHPRVREHQLSVPVPSKLRYLGSGAALGRILRGLDADLLLGYRVVSYGFAAARSGFHPLVLAGQGQWIVSPESPAGSRWCAQYALRRGDLVIAWAPHMADAMVALGADPSRLRVLNRGVRTDVFEPDPSIPREPIAVTTRQLAKYYRTDLVITAFHKAVASGSPGELWIAGDGPERSALEAQVRALGLARRVRMLGRVPHAELVALFKRASVYVSAVPSDGVSSSLLEAMSAGLLPIVVDNEPNRQWLDGTSTGCLVPEGDANAIAAAMTKLLSGSSTDENVRMTNRATVVDRADRRKNLAKMLGWWRELVESRR